MSFSNKNIEHDLRNKEQSILYIEILDCDFTVDEVKRAINTLKCGKSGGEHLLISEMFIE